MSQQDVYKLLKKKKKWMTSKEIKAILKVNSIPDNLRKLYQHGEVRRKLIKTTYPPIYAYKIK